MSTEIQSDSSPRPANHYSGAAVGAVSFGITALLAMNVTAVGPGLAAFAIVLALVSRAQLRRYPTLRGERLSLVAFILGVFVGFVALLPWITWLIATLLSYLSGR